MTRNTNWPALQVQNRDGQPMRDRPLSPEGLPQVPLQGVAASDIADLTSQLHDIHTAHRFAELYLEQPVVVSNNPHGDIRQALWTASLISYRRFFVSGAGNGKNQHRRPRGSEWLDTLPPDLLEAHKEIYERADHHIAHRVNKKMQQIRVYAVLRTPPEPRGVVEVETEMANLARPNPAMVRQLMEICTHLVGVVRGRRNLLRGNETERLNSEDNLDRLYRNATPKD